MSIVSPSIDCTVDLAQYQMLSMVWYFGLYNDKYFFPSNYVRETTSFNTFRDIFFNIRSHIFIAKIISRKKEVSEI